MCDKAVDSYLIPLKFAVFSNDYIVFGNLDSDFVAFFSNDIGLNSITFDNINLDDDNFDDCDPGTIAHVRLMARRNRYKQRKAFLKK